MLQLRRRPSENGFTVAEFVLVAVVVAALIAVATIAVRSIEESAAQRECETELRAIKAASEQFHAELGIYPPNDQALKDAALMELDETPNWRVVADWADGDRVRYEAVGSRCA